MPTLVFFNCENPVVSRLVLLLGNSSEVKSLLLKSATTYFKKHILVRRKKVQNHSSPKSFVFGMRKGCN